MQLALDNAKKVIEIELENFHAWMNNGIILRKANKLDESIKCLEKARVKFCIISNCY